MSLLRLRELLWHCCDEGCSLAQELCLPRVRPKSKKKGKPGGSQPLARHAGDTPRGGHRERASAPTCHPRAGQPGPSSLPGRSGGGGSSLPCGTVPRGPGSVFRFGALAGEAAPRTQGRRPVTRPVRWPGRGIWERRRRRSLNAPAWGLGGSAGSWSSRAFSEKGEDRGGKRGWEQGWSRGGGGGPEAHPPPCRPGSGSENGTWLRGEAGRGLPASRRRGTGGRGSMQSQAPGQPRCRGAHQCGMTAGSGLPVRETLAVVACEGI